MKTVIRTIIVIVAITMILVGVLRGEHEVVLKKAINICMECIGLG